MRPKPTTGAVIGANVRRIRTQRRLTQEEASRRCRGVGLDWSRVRIAALERGARASVDVAEAYLLALALDVTWSEIIKGLSARSDERTGP